MTHIQSDPLVLAASKYVEAKAPARQAPTPFYLVSFRNRMLRMLQDYFSRPDGFPQAADLPDTRSLTYNPSDARMLDVRATLSPKPPASERCIVWVRTPGLEFTKQALGDRNIEDPGMAHQYLLKKFEGTLVIMADHPDADVPPVLLDGLVTHIEGTKAFWMEEAGLGMLDVVSITDGEELDAPPVRVVRATLTVKYSGRLHLLNHVQSLPLKRVTQDVRAV